LAQDTPRLEIGIHATAIRLGDFRITLPQFEETQRGFGGRMTVNVTERFSIEGEVNVFPKDYRLNIVTTQNTLRELVNMDRTVQGLLGVKYGVRSNRFGLFAKARPGYTKVRLQTEIDDLPGAPRPRDDIFRWSGGYCLDLGVVFEVYPSKHTQFRLDFGNTRIRYTENALSPRGVIDEFKTLKYTSNNLQVSAGFGFRF
jgi:hypothetical protein